MMMKWAMGGKKSLEMRASMEERRPSITAYASDSQLHKLGDDVGDFIQTD